MEMACSNDSLSKTMSSSRIHQNPFVIVGNGPVGMRVAQELLRRLPDHPLVIYGEEEYEPYNRVRLSTWLAGEVALGDLVQPLRRPFGSSVDLRFGYRVEAINRESRTVTDSSGVTQPYSKLLLATGSEPFRPAITGVQLDGVFCLRDLDDATALMARRVRSRHTVVIGGGLLGLETARAMQRGNTVVTVIEHTDRLLARQLDVTASGLLQEKMRALQLQVVLQAGVAEICGDNNVTGIKLTSGKSLECDTVILATGIRPRIDLARSAQLAFGRGITVSDTMQTSDPDIYAIGECAEHRGDLYGLVAPGFEQAGVAAASIAGQQGNYTGSVAASRLKVLETSVFSMGPMGDEARSSDGRIYTYTNKKEGIYRKIVVRQHRLVGALGIGDWAETVRLQSSIAAGERFYPWQIARFLLSANLWSSQVHGSARRWPDSAIVCQCTGVNKGNIGRAMSQGACSLSQIQVSTGASTVCGSCKPLVLELLGGRQRLTKVAWSKGLIATSTLSLLLAFAILFLPVISYTHSVQASLLPSMQSPVHWDLLWRDGWVKRLTGFTILALFAVGLLISMRKRLPAWLHLGRFDTWRFAHAGLGSLAVLVLVSHTGLRMGHGLNFWLMICVAGLLVVGALSSAVVACEHRLQPGLASTLKRYFVWTHILLFWPVPVLLGWHIFKGYWY